MARYANEEDTRRLDQKRKTVFLFQMLAVVPIAVFFVLAFLGAPLGLFNEMPDFLGIGFFLFMALTVVFAILSTLRKKDFYKDFKDTLVNKVLYSNFENFNFQPELFIPQEEIRLLTSHQSFSYHGEDLITGIYKGVQYRQSDVDAYYYTGSGKHRRKVVLMNGRLASFFYPKCNNMSVVVTEKNMSHVNHFGLETVMMENMEFNRYFNVFASDQQSAFYLLTPQVMEYMQRLGRNCTLLVRFQNGIVYVLRHNIPGSFEVKMSKKIDLEKEAGNVIADMQELLGIVDVLKLDNV